MLQLGEGSLGLFGWFLSAI
jgi:hypothetical protein